MWALTIRNLLARKRRALLTGMAILLGVAFISATQILGATADRSLTGTAGDFYRKLSVDVVGTRLDADSQRTDVPLSLADQIRVLPGVRAVLPLYQVPVTVMKSSGKIMAGQVIAGTWYDDDVQPLQLAGGRAPARPGEVALTRSVAKSAGVALGKTMRFESAQGPVEDTVVGILRTPSSATAGVPAMVLSADAAAQLDPAGSTTELGVVGGDPQALTAQVKALAARSGAKVDVRTGTAAADEATRDAKEGAKAITIVVAVFGGLSLFVGLFIIYNTFTILLAQRSREMALLRAIGVRRRQVSRAVLGEAALTGVFSAVVGAVLGIGVAVIGRALILKGIDGPLVVRPQDLLGSIVLGVVATVLSAWLPARRASKVAPLEALRSSATEGGRFALRRTIIGSVLAALSVLCLIRGLSPHAENAAGLVGAAAGIGFIAIVVLMPSLCAIVVPVIGAPLRALRGPVGQLATENALRNPKRTGSTAVALMIGVTIISLFLVVAASLKSAVSTSITKQVTAAYLVSPVQPAAGLSAASVDAVRKAAAPAPIATSYLATAKVDGSVEPLVGLDASNLDGVADVRPTAGSLADVQGDSMMVDKDVAKDKGWSLGAKVSVEFPGGTRRTMTIAAIGQPLAFGAQYLVSAQQLRALDPSATISQVLVGQVSGGQAPTRTGLESALKPFPNAEVDTPKSLAKKVNSQIDLLLRVMLGFVALSVIIAFVGVTNTLALSVHERTRELGILRAIAMRRSHIRSAVRWEAALIATFGTVIGVLFGGGFGAALSWQLKIDDKRALTVPWGQLVLVLVIAAIAGALAAALPARRAAKLNILDAIHEL